MLNTHKKKSSERIPGIHISTFFFGIVILFLVCVIKLPNTKDVLAHFYAGTSVLDHKIPIPRFRYDCDKDGLDPEFHSLRPYQAAPCGDSDKILFCKNDYNLMESVSTTWDPSTCTPNGGSYTCAVDMEIEKVYVIDGEYARFPIMGNTEAVTNSQGP